MTVERDRDNANRRVPGTVKQNIKTLRFQILTFDHRVTVITHDA
jgi:hypothetical protein